MPDRGRRVTVRRVTTVTPTASLPDPTPPSLDAVVEAALACGLGEAERRRGLLEGLGPSIMGQLVTAARPAEQLRPDLWMLCEYRVEGGRAAVTVWLGNALRLAGPRPEAAVFERARAHGIVRPRVEAVADVGERRWPWGVLGLMAAPLVALVVWAAYDRLAPDEGEVAVAADAETKRVKAAETLVPVAGTTPVGGDIGRGDGIAPPRPTVPSEPSEPSKISDASESTEPFKPERQRRVADTSKRRAPDAEPLVVDATPVSTTVTAGVARVTTPGTYALGVPRAALGEVRTLCLDAREPQPGLLGVRPTCAVLSAGQAEALCTRNDPAQRVELEGEVRWSRCPP